METRAVNIVTPDATVNTLYQDNFEAYSSGQALGASANNPGSGNPINDIFAGGNGWSYTDRDGATTTLAGGGAFFNITGGNFFSCCKAMEIRSPNATNGIADIDRKIAVNPSTQLVTASSYFAISKTYTNRNNNNAHISMETYASGSRYEAPVFLYSQATGTTTHCPTYHGIAADFYGTTTLGNVGTDHYAAICLSTWDDSSGYYGGGSIFHHLVETIDIINLKWVSVQIDGVDFTTTVCPAGVCLYLSNHGADNWASFGPYHIFRWEIGANNNAVAFTNPTDVWYSWHDDLIITDTTQGIATCGGGGVNVQSGQGNTNSVVQPGCITVNTSSFFLGFTTAIAVAITGIIYWLGRHRAKALVYRLRTQLPEATDP